MYSVHTAARSNRAQPELKSARIFLLTRRGLLSTLTIRKVGIPSPLGGQLGPYSTVEAPWASVGQPFPKVRGVSARAPPGPLPHL